MQARKPISILKWSIITLLALGVFSPLLVWSRYLFPFITTKVLFFRFVVELALALYVVLCCIDARFRPHLRGKGAWIVLSFGGYILLQTIASLVGESWYKSFWGTVERGEGLILLYHLFAWFIMLRSMLTDEKQWLGFLHVQSAATAFVALYGVAQWLNVSFVLFPGEGRIASTLGNASFFAGYMLFGICIAFRFILDRTQRVLVRSAYVAVAIVELVMLYQSETRGALLGLISGIALFGVLSITHSASKAVKRAGFGALVLAVLFIALVIGFRNSDVIRSYNTLYRLGSIVNPNDITRQSRLFAWDSSWKAFLDRPLFGYGFEHYNIAFNRYFHAEIYKDQGSQVWFDRAHNAFFDVLVTGGVMTFVVYLALFGVSIFMLYRRFRRDHRGLVCSGTLIVAIVSYLFQNLFVFDTLPLYLWIVSMFAMSSVIVDERETNASLVNRIVRRARSVFQNIKDESADIARVEYPRSVVLGIEHAVVAFGTLVVFVLVARATLFIPHQAASKAVLGLAYQRADMVAKGMSLLSDAIALDSNYTYEIRHKYAEQAIYADRNDKVSTEEKQRYLRVAIEGIKENMKSIPRDVQNHLYLITLYNIYDAYDPTVLSLVYPLGKEALELSPTRPQIYYGLGQAALSQKRFQEGVAYFEKALALNPEPLESSWNLAAAYEIAGRTRDAERVFRDLQERGLDLHTSPMLQRMIPVYAETNNFLKLKEIYLELVALEPTNADWWTRLAAVYGQLGEYEFVRAAVQKAVELNPELAVEAKVFLESLGLK